MFSRRDILEVTRIQGANANFGDLTVVSLIGFHVHSDEDDVLFKGVRDRERGIDAWSGKLNTALVCKDPSILIAELGMGWRALVSDMIN